MEINVIRSRRKTISIQVNSDSSVTVRAPLRVSNREIEKFVKEHEDWINKSIKKIKEREMALENIPKLSYDELKSLGEKALVYIPERAKFFAQIIGVRYKSITIRNQRTRWGSCSSKGGLNFNCLLMLAPPDVLDYVVVHELCHIKEMNHSKEFWAEVEKVLPDYKIKRKWLKDHGDELMGRM